MYNSVIHNSSFLGYYFIEVSQTDKHKEDKDNKDDTKNRYVYNVATQTHPLSNLYKGRKIYPGKRRIISGKI